MSMAEQVKALVDRQMEGLRVATQEYVWLRCYACALTEKYTGCRNVMMSWAFCSMTLSS